MVACAGLRSVGWVSLTRVEQVHTIGEAIGRPLRYEEISPGGRLSIWGSPDRLSDVNSRFHHY